LDSKDHGDGGSKLLRSVGKYLKTTTTMMMMMMIIIIIVIGPGYLSRYSGPLRVGWSGDGIPVGAIYSAPIQTDPGAHPFSYTMGTGSFTEVKRPGRGADHLPTSSAEVKERVELNLYSPSGPSWPVLG
jgi:hypothetical protein